MDKRALLMTLALTACGEVYDTTTGLGACMAYIDTYNACVSQVGSPGGFGGFDGLEDSLCELYDEATEDFDAEAAEAAATAFNCGREAIEAIDCADPIDFPNVFTAIEDCEL